MQLLPNLCFPEHPAPGSRLLTLEAEWVTSAVIPLSLRHSLLCIHAFPALGMELVRLWFWVRDHVALGSFAGSLQPLQLYPMAKPLVVTHRLPSVHVAELLVPPQGRDSCGDMRCKCSVTANSAGQLLGFVAVTGVDLD